MQILNKTFSPGHLYNTVPVCFILIKTLFELIRNETK